MDAYEIGTTSYRKTRQNLVVAFSFNGIGVSAATKGLVHPVFARIAMVQSVTAVLATRFVGQLLFSEGVKTDFTVEEVDQERFAVEAESESEAKTASVDD